MGKLKDGKPNGQGTLYFNDGSIYSGIYENGLPNNKGIMKHLNGAKWIGGYQAG